MSTKYLKKILLLFTFILLIIFLGNAQANVFDLRTNKHIIPAFFPVEFDNLPYLYCCSAALYGYSGIFTGDTIMVSGRTAESDVKIKFPSGKYIAIPVKNGYFEQEVTFDEEGDYEVNGEEYFQVLFCAIPVPPTPIFKDIFNSQGSSYPVTFGYWDNAILVEEGKTTEAYLLLVDKDGNPLVNYSTKSFKTDEKGIAKITVNANDNINIYGPVKKIKYVKLVFDKNGKLTYSSKKGSIRATFVNDKLLVNPDDLTKVVYDFTFKEDFEVGENYIYSPIDEIAYPAYVARLDNTTYVEAAPLIEILSHRYISYIYVNSSNSGVEIYIGIDEIP